MVALSLTMLAMHSFAAVSLTMISLWPMALRKRTCGAGRRGGAARMLPPMKKLAFGKCGNGLAKALRGRPARGGSENAPPSVAWGGGHEKAPRPTGCALTAGCGGACLSRRASDA